MSNETIPLAKGFKPEKLDFPVYFSEKFDGVPIKLTVDVPACPATPTWRAVTRQDEPVLSCTTILEDFVHKNFAVELQTTGQHVFVGEVVQAVDPRAPFKDTSGIVRRQADQGWLLKMHIFDYWLENGHQGLDLDSDAAFEMRWLYMTNLVHSTAGVRRVVQNYALNEEGLAEYRTHLLPPKAEGGIARSHSDKSITGKRSWGYQKLLNEPTVDLNIIGCEEAVSASGEKLGMAGRLLALYKGETIGIGPGKLKHAERKQVLEYFQKPLAGPRLAQIKYKKDDSYTALRQPTFQHWRDDKTEESYE